MLLLIHQPSFATHIVGGELNYIYLGNQFYKISLKLYVDCQNGQPEAIRQDRTAIIGVFAKNDSSLLSNLSFEVLRKSPIRVSKTNYNCIAISPDACVDAYDYDTIISLPKRKQGYILTFQRCCRNNTILNIVNPLSTGENIWTFINDMDSIGNNSSPYFKNLPPNFLCTNAPLLFDHSATDADGDSLVYEFFHPYTGGFTFNPRPGVFQLKAPPFDQIIFNSGYTFNNAINSLPNVSIDKQTGLLKLTPTLEGQFVVGIVVKEYRNGQLIGFTQRDYQFNVQKCVFNTISAFTTPIVNCDRQVIFNNNSTNAKQFYWNFGDSSTNKDTSTKKTGIYTYPKIGKYWVKLIVADGNCVDSIEKQIEIYDKIYFKLPKDTVLCSKASLIVKADTSYSQSTFLWNNGSTDSFIIVNAPGQYWLKLKRLTCETYDTINVVYDSLKTELKLDSLVCQLDQMVYKGQVSIHGAFKTINWFSEPNQTREYINDSLVFFSKNGYFKVSGNNKNNCPYEHELTTSKRNNSEIYKVPNVFTPNTDAFNPTFPGENMNYKYELMVYNRWGVLVFKGSNEAWNGDDFSTGVYYYFLDMKACDYENKVHGVVHLIR